MQCGADASRSVAGGRCGVRVGGVGVGQDALDVWGVLGLDLGRNSLQALPAGVARWTAITSLSVAGNGLAALHPALGLCHTLQARLPPSPLNPAPASPIAYSHCRHSAHGPSHAFIPHGLPRRPSLPPLPPRRRPFLLDASAGVGPVIAHAPQPIGPRPVGLRDWEKGAELLEQAMLELRRTIQFGFATAD